MRIEHVAMYVNDIEKARDFRESLESYRTNPYSFLCKQDGFEQEMTRGFLPDMIF